MRTVETALVAQWFRLHLPMYGVQFQSLVGKLRSHLPSAQKTKKKKKKKHPTQNGSIY